MSALAAEGQCGDSTIATTVITLVDGTMRIFQADFAELVAHLQNGANVLMLREAGGGTVAIPVSAVLSLREGVEAQRAGAGALSGQGGWLAV